MVYNRKKAIYSCRLKFRLSLFLIAASVFVSTHAFSQNPPPPGPPSPPPPPDELFRKINPFKKHKKDTANKATDTSGKIRQNTLHTRPPTPPNPLDLFKRKKKDTTKAGKN